jgi:hypothetical protein
MARPARVFRPRRAGQRVYGRLQQHAGGRSFRHGLSRTEPSSNQQIHQAYLGVPQSTHPKPSRNGESVGHYEGNTLDEGNTLAIDIIEQNTKRSRNQSSEQTFDPAHGSGLVSRLRRSGYRVEPSIALRLLSMTPPAAPSPVFQTPTLQKNDTHFGETRYPPRCGGDSAL